MAKSSVLIVEDEKILALDLKEKIEEMGPDLPKIVSSGDSTIRAAELSSDLVLMDIMLKRDINGIQDVKKEKLSEHPDGYPNSLRR